MLKTRTMWLLGGVRERMLELKMSTEAGREGTGTQLRSLRLLPSSRPFLNLWCNALRSFVRHISAGRRRLQPSGR